HLFLAALDEEAALRITLADVTGVEPTVGVEDSVQALGVGLLALAVEHRTLGSGHRSLVVPTRHVLSAHEDLAIVGDADLDALDRRTDRSLARLEWMVQRDDRRGFGEAVTLHDHEAKASPEFFDIRRERRSADHERPELQAERAVHATVLPPSALN